LEIYFEYPLYLVIVAVLISAAISFFFYFRDKTFKDLEAWKRWLMTFLRFSFVLIILLLLLSPVIKTKGLIVQKPIIVFAQDNSSSIIMNKDSLYYQGDYKNDIESVLEDLSDDYDVRIIKFDELTYNDSIVDFTGNQTDISGVFD